ncbi:hypothetical protein D3C80_1281960 [compost metagenome]
MSVKLATLDFQRFLQVHANFYTRRARVAHAIKQFGNGVHAIAEVEALFQQGIVLTRLVGTSHDLLAHWSALCGVAFQ